MRSLASAKASASARLRIESILNASPPGPISRSVRVAGTSDGPSVSPGQCSARVQNLASRERSPNGPEPTTVCSTRTRGGASTAAAAGADRAGLLVVPAVAVGAGQSTASISRWWAEPAAPRRAGLARSCSASNALAAGHPPLPRQLCATKARDRDRDREGGLFTLRLAHAGGGHCSWQSLGPASELPLQPAAIALNAAVQWLRSGDSSGWRGLCRARSWLRPCRLDVSPVLRAAAERPRQLQAEARAACAQRARSCGGRLSTSS